jgi:isochorismate synthase
MNTLTSATHYNRVTQSEILLSLMNYADAENLPFALWRLPNKHETFFILADEKKRIPRNTQIEELAPGFVFAPYEVAEDAFYLNAEHCFVFENGKVKEPSGLFEKSKELLERALTLERKSRKFRVKNPFLKRSLADETNFITLVNRSIDEIEKGSFEKVVPSRTKEIALSQDFDIVEAFDKLCRRYGHALVSFVHLPGVGSWLGASPEMLVSVQDQHIFKTVALAGTQPFVEGMNLKSVAWTQKEIEEQALVERYVISCFKKIRVREYDEHGPKTVVAGNLIHLKSDFQVDMKAINFPQLASTMLQLLHPTSAVCGMPLEPTYEFLKKHEKYDREFYSGYLGPVNIEHNIDIFVNLRCMQIFEDKAILYAGAGVTSDSVPEEEFEETEMKFNTLLNVIR